MFPSGTSEAVLDYAQRGTARGEGEEGDNRQYEDEQADCTYPVDWTLSIPELNAVFFVKPLFDEQSLYGVTTPPYWEGLCSVEGTLDNKTMGGSAYVELCGYENDQLIYTGPSS